MNHFYEEILFEIFLIVYIKKIQILKNIILIIEFSKKVSE
jgi:hypothetical protein